MFSFVARPNPPTANVEVKILDSKKNMVRLEIKIEADLTQVYSPIQRQADMLREDLKLLLINHVSKKIRKSIKVFTGEVVSAETYDTNSVMRIRFSNTKKKEEWIKHANKSEQLSVEAFNKDFNTALHEIWRLVLCRVSGKKIFAALRESLENLQEGTNF